MYLRILHRDRPDTEDEATQLRAVLAHVGNVTSLERHPRGGFAVQCEPTHGLTSLLEHITAAGYLSVV